MTFTHLRRAVSFGLHQLTIAIGISFFPIAMFMRRLGIDLPVHRLVETTAAVYEDADGS